MTDNPYAGDYTEPGLDGPKRTSALAVTSLVLSLICCIPPLSLLGAGLGVGALIAIGSSRGRVGGRGLAIAGIVIGLLVTFAQLGVFWAVSSGTSQLSQKAAEIFADLEAGRYDEVRAELSPPAANATDEELAAFVAAYQAELGAFQSTPDGALAYIGGFFDPAVGPIMQRFQGRQNLAPVPTDFAQSTGVIAFGFTPGGAQPHPVDLVIFTPDAELALSDYIGAAPTPPPAEPTDAPPPDEEP